MAPELILAWIGGGLVMFLGFEIVRLRSVVKAYKTQMAVAITQQDEMGRQLEQSRQTVAGVLAREQARCAAPVNVHINNEQFNMWLVQMVERFNAIMETYDKRKVC